MSPAVNVADDCQVHIANISLCHRPADVRMRCALKPMTTGELTGN